VPPPTHSYIDHSTAAAAGAYPAHMWQMPPPLLPEVSMPLFSAAAASYIYPSMMPPMCWTGGQMGPPPPPSAFMLPPCPPPSLPPPPANMKRKNLYEETGEEMYKRQRLCTGN
jgi:hypothetical protein